MKDTVSIVASKLSDNTKLMRMSASCSCQGASSHVLIVAVATSPDTLRSYLTCERYIVTIYPSMHYSLLHAEQSTCPGEASQQIMHVTSDHNI